MIISTNIKEIFNADKPVKWLFYGDSITHGCFHTFGERNFVELFTERIRYELARSMDIVINTAKSGDNSEGLISTFDWRVAQFNPDVVFIMIGMNDCSNKCPIGLNDFEVNLLKLTEMLKKLDALPILQTTCPILPGQAPERFPYFDSYMDVIRKVASNRKLPLIDHTKYWQEHSDNHFYWMSNAFHPNSSGHKAMAEYIFQCLEIC